MIFKKKKKQLCETPVCDKELSDQPYTVVVGEHSFQVCDECGKLMEVLHEKFDERLGDESLRLSEFD